LKLYQIDNIKEMIEHHAIKLLLKIKGLYVFEPKSLSV